MARTVITINAPIFKLADTQAGLTTGKAYECQLTSATVTPQPVLNTVPATGCAPASQSPGRTGFQIDLAWLQDWSATDSLSKYAYDNDTLPKWFSLALDADSVPLATGQVYVVAGAYGGTFGDGTAANATRSMAVLGQAGHHHGVSAASFEKRLQRLNAIPDAAVRASARAVIKIAEQEGGTVTLGKKRRRVKLSAVARVKPVGPDATEVSIWGKPTGPWVWQSSGTNSHPIPKRKPTPKKPRPMYASGYEHPVQNKQITGGGRGGKGAWTKVEARAAKIVPEIFDDEIHKVVNRG